MEKTKYKSTKEQHDGKTYVVVRNIPVQLERGISCRPASLFVRECSYYDNEIIFSNGERTSSARNILDLMTLGASKGRKLDVFVEDLPETYAEDIAKRLYSGLTTNSDQPDFDRLWTFN